MKETKAEIHRLGR